jgi:hypothetical protein
MGIALAVSNLWITWSRSTIPWALDTQVVEREVRHEKHPGQDDVCLLKLEDGSVRHIDAEVFHAINEGDRLQKDALKPELLIARPGGDGAVLALKPSADFRGMAPVMGGAVVVMGLLSMLAGQRTRGDHASTTSADSPPA